SKLGFIGLETDDDKESLVEITLAGRIDVDVRRRENLPSGSAHYHPFFFDNFFAFLPSHYRLTGFLVVAYRLLESRIYLLFESTRIGLLELQSLLKELHLFLGGNSIVTPHRS